MDTRVKRQDPHGSRGADALRSQRRRLLLAAAGLALVAALPPARAAELPATPASRELRVERDGDAIVVAVQADVDADRATTWSTLTDYDHLAEFVPELSASRTLARTGNQAIVEQQGSAGVGPFRQKFTVRLAVTEQLHRSIHASGIGGDFKHFDSNYELVPIDARRTRIVYRARLEPAIPVPPLLGLKVLRASIRDQFDALLQETQRRAGNA